MTILTFALDHRLADSSHFIEDWGLCRVSLKNDKTWPWLYLVPRRENIREMCDLSAADQLLLVQEMALDMQSHPAAWPRRQFEPDVDALH